MENDVEIPTNQFTHNSKALKMYFCKGNAFRSALKLIGKTLTLGITVSASMVAVGGERKNIIIRL